MTDAHNMISKDKQYRTKIGYEVRIYATDGAGSHCVHGAFKDSSGWQEATWTIDGEFASENSGLDLVEVKPRIKRTYFVNLYNPPEGESILYLRHEQAMANRKDGWVGCAKIKIDIEEGEQQV